MKKDTKATTKLGLIIKVTNLLKHLKNWYKI